MILEKRQRPLRTFECAVPRLPRLQQGAIPSSSFDDLWDSPDSCSSYIRSLKEQTAERS
ncbi:hypothetical protein D3C72_625120 [compost metagenome]